jgi:hypothetical protein
VEAAAAEEEVVVVAPGVSRVPDTLTMGRSREGSSNPPATGVTVEEAVEVIVTGVTSKKEVVREEEWCLGGGEEEEAREGGGAEATGPILDTSE